MKNKTSSDLSLRVFEKLLKESDVNKNGKEDDDEILLDEEDVDQVAPPGGEKVVRALKKNKKVKNPWSVAWSMKNKGYI